MRNARRYDIHLAIFSQPGSPILPGCFTFGGMVGNHTKNDTDMSLMENSNLEIDIEKQKICYLSISLTFSTRKV
jgi:hypothetical protein